jgi:hypothetical protein
MSQRESDINLLSPVVNFCDQAVLVASDVENDARANRVRMWKVDFRISKVVPVRSFCHSVPGFKRAFRVHALAPEIP